MSEFEVAYRKYCGSPVEYIFVEAASEADAKLVAVDYIKRNGGHRDYVMVSVTPYTKPAGRVL